jgi:hypothetical protein
MVAFLEANWLIEAWATDQVMTSMMNARLKTAIELATALKVSKLAEDYVSHMVNRARFNRGACDWMIFWARWTLAQIEGPEEGNIRLVDNLLGRIPLPPTSDSRWLGFSPPSVEPNCAEACTEIPTGADGVGIDEWNVRSRLVPWGVARVVSGKSHSSRIPEMSDALYGGGWCPIYGTSYAHQVRRLLIYSPFSDYSGGSEHSGRS